jgi:hypothetical protein
MAHDGSPSIDEMVTDLRELADLDATVVELVKQNERFAANLDAALVPAR